MAAPEASPEKSVEILNTFKNFQSHQVAPLGYYLGVEYARVQIIIGANGSPQTQAYGIYQFWYDKTGGNLENEERKRSFSNALVHCGHGRAADKLNYSPATRARRQTLKGLDENTVYMKLITVDRLNDNKIRRFGFDLGLTKVQVDSIIARHTPNDYKPVIAIAVFVEWKNNLKENNLRTLKQLENALVKIGYKETIQTGLSIVTKPPAEPTTGTTTQLDSAIDESTQHAPANITIDKSTQYAPANIAIDKSTQYVPANIAIDKSTQYAPANIAIDKSTQYAPANIAIDESTQHAPAYFTHAKSTTKVSNDKKPTPKQKLKFLGCILIVAFIGLFILSEPFIVLSFVHKEVKVMVLPGDVISLPLPSYAPPSLNVFLWGQEDTCFAEVLIAKCKDINTTQKANEYFPDVDYNYFAPDSSVTISGNMIRPYQIWLFSDKFDADSAVNEQFHSYDCSSAADHGALCAQLNAGEDTATIRVTEPSYYYIRCEQEPFNCSQIENWKIHKMMYSFDMPPDRIISITTVQVQSVPSKIRVRNFLTASHLCLIARLNKIDCASSGKYLMDIHYSSVYHEIQVYLAIGTILLIVLIASCMCMILCCRHQRKNNAVVKSTKNRTKINSEDQLPIFDDDDEIDL